MAKQNRAQQEQVNPTTESGAENIGTTGTVEPTVVKKEVKREIALKPGQCIIAPAGKEDEEILTSLDDWNSLYNAGPNQGRFVLKAEKKSS